MSEPPRKPVMTEAIAVTINGKEIEAQKGELLIDAAQRNGTYIPRFCYHPRMTPVGMCRMCLVEVDTGRGPALQPSCMIECAPNMVVDTESDNVRKAQDGVLEFLLINHPLDCPVCDKGGECPLQDQTMAYGPGESRWVEEKRHYTKPIAISETVYLDRERCILCDRCTRFADEVAGDPLIHFMDRGAATQVNTFPGEPFSSYFSGNVVQICPVGALTAKPYRFKARPWDLEQVESTCQGCSVGCRITVESSRDRLLRYNGVDSDPVNWGWLCDKGRFGFEAINSEDRLSGPLVRSGDALVPAHWNDALGAAAAAITSGLSTGGGAGAVAVLGGARLTNESAYAWAKLAKGVIGTDNVDAQLGDGLPADVVLGLPTATIDEVCTPGGVILYLGPDPKEELPVLFLRLKHAVERDGAKLVEVVPARTGLSRWATATVTYPPGEAASVVAALLDGSADLDQAAVAALAGATNVTVVLGRPSLAESAASIVDAAAAIVAARPEARFLSGLRRSNVMGALDAGLAPGMLPGRVRRADAHDHYTSAWGGGLPESDGLDAHGILTAAAEGRIDTLILVGADPISDFPDRALAERGIAGARTVIAIDTFLTESSRRADIVLAAAAFGEVSGTTTNIEGRVSRLAQKVTAPGTARADWAIVIDLAARLGRHLGVSNVEDIAAEMARLAPSWANVTAEFLAASGHEDGVVLPLPVSETVAHSEVPEAEATAEPEPDAAEPDADVVVVEAPRVLPPLVSFVAPTPTTIPSPDAYGFRLVVNRTMYDRGVLLSNSPSSSGLADAATARMNPVDLETLGLVTGAAVKLIAGDRSIVLPSRSDAGVPKGTVVVPHHRSESGPTTLISADHQVCDVRIEVAS